MAAVSYPSFSGSAISTLALSPKLSSPLLQISQSRHCSVLAPSLKLRLTSKRGPCTRCCLKNNNPEESVEKDNGLNWRILKRWDVPWNWQTISLTPLACGLSLVLTGLIEAVAFKYLGLNIEELSLDEMAGLLFVGQGITTVLVLAVLYRLTKSFSPFPEDIYRHDWQEPFNLKKGWLLWARIGFGGALVAVTVIRAAMYFFNGGSLQSETDAFALLLPFIGSSSISTACVVGIVDVLAPILEETFFRGFFYGVSDQMRVYLRLTHLYEIEEFYGLPTPLSVFISAAVFAGAHFSPGTFLQMLAFGIAMGLSYAQTHNLLTPITIHALWNSGLVL